MSGTQRLLRALGVYRDKDKDPVKWNEQWEAWLRKDYAPRDTYRAPGFDATAITTQSTFSKIQDDRSQLIYMQAALARLIEDFPISETWLSLPPKTRQDHLLKAIVENCRGPGAELNRILCPEINMSFLERDGGKGFLQLLATACPPSGAHAVEPVLVGHPVFDAKWSDADGHVPARRTVEEWRIAVVMTKYERNMFLCTFLVKVCMIIRGFGMPESPEIHKGLTSLSKRFEEMKGSPMPEVYTGSLKEVHKQGPSPEWNRPAALEEQISLLRADSSLSYVLMQSAGNRRHSIALTDPPEVAQAFINFRNSALYKGDLQAVALMSKVLCCLAKDFGLTKEDVFQQLSTEYGTNPEIIEAELDNIKKNFLPALRMHLEDKYDGSDHAIVMGLS